VNSGQISVHFAAKEIHFFAYMWEEPPFLPRTISKDLLLLLVINVVSKAECSFIIRQVLQLGHCVHHSIGDCCFFVTRAETLPIDGQIIISTKTPILDGLFANYAGLFMDTLILIGKNGTTDYAEILLYYYAAEGLI
jgi:hypothetical protein